MGVATIIIALKDGKAKTEVKLREANSKELAILIATLTQVRNRFQQKFEEMSIQGETKLK